MFNSLAELDLRNGEFASAFELFERVYQSAPTSELLMKGLIGQLRASAALNDLTKSKTLMDELKTKRRDLFVNPTTMRIGKKTNSAYDDDANNWTLSELNKMTMR